MGTGPITNRRRNKLAFLREIEALVGARCFDPQSGRYTIPPLGMFDLFILVRFNGVELAGVTRAPDGGRRCGRQICR